MERFFLKTFMPETTQKIAGQLNTKHRTLEELEKFGLYANGNKVIDKPGNFICTSGCQRGYCRGSWRFRLPEKEFERSSVRSGAAKRSRRKQRKMPLILSRRRKLPLKILKTSVPGGRDHCLRGSKKIQKASVLPGKNRKPGAPDRVRHQSTLFTGGNGGQKGYGRYQPETGQAGGNPE